jgi:SWI/SNF-related matrix-associated actin-dependent regulator 1 of chromatin subfamily A
MAQIKRVTLAENQFGEPVVRIECPYDLTLINQIRSLPGRKYHSDEYCWSAPLFPDTVLALRNWGFVLSTPLIEYLQKHTAEHTQIATIGIPGLKGTLFPYQSIGVAFIESHNGRALIADEMGLGKTIEVLAWLQLHRDYIPVVIIVPASLKFNWAREAELWMPNPHVEILSSTSPWKTTGKILIINYDVVADWLPWLRTLNPQVLILDEVHYIKSNRTRRTKAVKILSKGIPYIIALSGTPIVNRPIEAYNAIRLISPNLFPDAWWYARHYCAARHNGFGWNFSGASNTFELHEQLSSTIMLRRLKHDVLPDLPDKLYAFVPIELDNATEYASAEKDFVAYIRRTKDHQAAVRASAAEGLVAVEGLKQLAVAGKLRHVITWINDFLDVADKLVVFATHRFVIDQLMKEFGKFAVKIDGSTSLIDRQQAVDDFQTKPEIKLFIGNIQAAGVGITLTAASNVAFVELPWTPGALVQAIDRLHRIGQKDNVTVHYLLAIGTIEERIAHLIDRKQQTVDAVLDGIITEQESLLSELMQTYIETNLK